MQLFTFISEKKIGKEIIRVPAVLFTNNSHDMRTLKQAYPGLQFRACHSVDSYGADVPLDEILYSNKEDINLVVINAELEERILTLESQIRHLENKQEPLKNYPEESITSGEKIPLGSLGEEVVEIEKENQS